MNSYDDRVSYYLTEKIMSRISFYNSRDKEESWVKRNELPLIISNAAQQP